MKIIFLAPITSMHAIRWANAMVNRGIEVIYVTNAGNFIDYLDDRVRIKYLKYSKPFGFVLNKFFLEKIIKETQPDLLHIHQAAGYALLGTLLSFKKKIVSIYGFEVYRLPYKSYLHKKIIEFILKNTPYLASTSYDMKNQVNHLYPNLKKKIYITPFGINTKEFCSLNKKKNDKVVIGIIKKLEEVYGIKYLIEAFKKLYYDYDLKEIELKIVGKGSLKNELINKVNSLKLNDKVQFIDRIQHEEVPLKLNEFDIFCAPSLSESFGVAIIEASACEIPVVVSDVGGLPEVVENGKTGYVVESKNSDALAKQLYRLCVSKKLRKTFGANGREKVLKEYDWDNNVNEMIKIYEKIRSN